MNAVSRTQVKQAFPGLQVLVEWQVAVSAEAEGFDPFFGNGGTVRPVKHRHELCSAYLQQEVVLRIHMVGGHGTRRRYEHEGCLHARPRVGGVGGAQDGSKTVLQEFAVSTTALDVLKNHPQVAILDSLDRLLD